MKLETCEEGEAFTCPRGHQSREAAFGMRTVKGQKGWEFEAAGPYCAVCLDEFLIANIRPATLIRE